MRGGNINVRSNRPRLHHPSQPPAGPAMIGHSQGLKDIDMELELLKRKREIIQQQQHIMSNSYRVSNNFGQPQFGQSSDNNYTDYMRLYDDPRESQGYGGGTSNRKRPHIPVWDNESPPKLFSAPSRGVWRAFGSRLGPPGNRPYKPRPNLPPPPSQNKREFNPTKVTKPSVGAPPAKLASLQPAERKKLVTETLASSGAMVRTLPGGSDAWILRVDCEPTRQMTGRLELALGAIMKDLKLANPSYGELFKQPLTLRVMKQAVRDRIKTAMIGDVVHSPDVIKSKYYDMFPPGDDHVVMLGLEARKNSFITIKAEDAETYFKKNIYKLMSMKLDEMISKLEQQYIGNSNAINPRKGQRTYNKAQSKTESIPNEAGSNAEDIQLETKTDTPQNKTESQPKSNEAEPNQDVDQSMTEEAPGPEIQTKPGETELKSASPTEPVGAALNEVSDKKTSGDLTPPPELVNTVQYKAFDKLMTCKILHLLKKFSPTILNIMNVDEMYQKTKEDIINETRQMLVGNKKDVQQPPESQAQEGMGLTLEKSSFHPQYHVKILGKPSLPKRKAMDLFFNEFKPQYIKKHRTINNLLFAGFAEKESFDKILAANGMLIGDHTLEIRAGERNTESLRNNQSNANTDTSVVVVDSETPAANTDEQGIVIDSDLDGQISDLLSSIRRTELDSSSDDVTWFEPPSVGDHNNVQKENEDQTGKIESDAAIEIAEPQKEVKNEAMNNELKKNTPNKVENTPEVIIMDNDEDEPDCAEVKDGEKMKDEENDDPEKKDVVAALKTEVKDVKGTPIKASDKEVKGAENEDAEKKDIVAGLKTEVKDVKGTPTRASARLATPGGIRTRRMSKLE